MLELLAFLRARWDEDEAAARECDEVYPAPWEVTDRGYIAKVCADEPHFPIVAELEQSDTIDGWLGDRLQHIARHDPARVLADIEAKRRIAEVAATLMEQAARDPGLDASGVMTRSMAIAYETTLRLLALPFADHQDHRDEWRA